MIVEDFLVINSRGLYCRYGDFYLDPKEPSPRAIVSHAHGDHAVRGNDIVYCTPATAAIMKHRYQKNAGNTILKWCIN
jgi:putative mRNA 3-end processing factor